MADSCQALRGNKEEPGQLRGFNLECLGPQTANFKSPDLSFYLLNWFMNEGGCSISEH